MPGHSTGRTKMQKLAAIMIAVGSTTCCPSLFLSMEKTSPAPRPAMPDAQIAGKSIPAPSYMDNRFLDEAPGANTGDYREYSDNPQDLPSLARALISLEQLENKFGASRVKRLEVDGRSFAQPSDANNIGVTGT